MKRERSCTFWLIVLTAMLAAGEARALTDEEIFRDFRFNFLSPGAPAQGLGGAFIAAAADATAAEANPAALHYLSRQEAFVEYRAVRPDVQLLAPSRVFGSNAPASTEDFTDFLAVTNREEAELFSFAAYAYPFKIGGRRATIAFSRQLVLDTEVSLMDAPVNETFVGVSRADYPVVVVPDPEDPNAPPSIERYSIRNEVMGALDTELFHNNISFSIALSTDFSFGATATLADLSMTSLVDSRVIDERGVLTSVHPRVNVGGVFSDIRTQTTIDDSDTDLTYTLGFHWHPDTIYKNKPLSPLRMGVVYRKGAQLEVEEARLEFDPEVGAGGGFVPFGAPFANVLKVPDRWGAGFSYELKHWLFAVDVERVQYSDLLEDFRTGINFFTSGEIDLLDDVNTDSLVFDVDDATVVHAGTEFNFRSGGDWRHFFRLGYFNAPDNKIRLVGLDTVGPPEDTSFDEILLDLFRGGKDLDHYTVGFGFSTPAGIQFHLAADFSDAGDEFVVSAIHRFGRVK